MSGTSNVSTMGAANGARSMQGSFVCILPPKSLQLGSDGSLQRAFHELELQQALHAIDFSGREHDFLFLPGAGMAIEHHEQQGPSSFVSGSCMCAFSGSLDNYPYLVKKYCLPESAEALADDPKVAALKRLNNDLTLNEIGSSHPMLEAEVICMLYLKLGTSMLPKLRGEFAFVIFDSKLVRVLAARDPHGGIELAQARTTDGSLVIASGQFLPEGCRDLMEIRPGYYKYGWLSPPQMYTHSEEETRLGAETAAAAAQRALMGTASTLRTSSLNSHSLLAHAPSESGSDTSSVKGRTRRGKRAGKHQRQRQSLDEQRRSMEVDRATSAAEEVVARPSRLSLDSQQPLVSSAADRTDWWRPSSGRRHSLDIGGFRRNGSTAVGLSPLAPVFEPLSPSAPAEQPLASTLEAQPSSSSESPSEAEARAACAAVVGDIVAGMGVSRTRSSAALTSLASLADVSSRQQEDEPPEASSVAEAGAAATASAESSEGEGVVQQPAKAAKTEAHTLQGLESLPPDLVDKLAGPYREEAASVRMLANLLYRSPCALCITDATQPDMPIVHVNRVFEKATGYSAAEVLGRNCRFLQAPPGEKLAPSAASTAIRRALDSGRAKGVRLLNFMKDGTPMFNDLSIVPLRDAAGKITHHVGMQSFTPVPQGQEGSEQPKLTSRFGRGVQRAGGLGGLLAKSRSCVDLASMSGAEGVMRMR